MTFLELLAKVLTVVNGIIQLILNISKYLESQKKEKDSSAQSSPASDESKDELHK